MIRVFGQLVATLFVVALLLHYIWYIVAAVVIVIAYKVGHHMWQAQQAADEAERKLQDELRARADRHLQWWNQGDPRGLYGPAGADLMRQIH